MDTTSASAYSNLTNQLESYGNIIPKDLITSFQRYTQIIYKSDIQDGYSQPVPWIGMYIAFASLVCILAMMADLLHGFRNRKQWFPCKYFTLNAASLSMIGVAIKIPMDLTNLMQTRVDQVTKIGSMAFMCTMMVNSLPSLASMNNQQLVANVVALGVLVITLVVNVCIQIYTGVIAYPKSHDFVSFDKSMRLFADQNKVIASIYVAMFVLLLILYTASALAISECNHILEMKHRVAHERASDGLWIERLYDVEKLRKHVKKYWIMAETVTPEFMTVCNATACASGVICVISTILFTRITLHLGIHNHDSDYKWSIPVILVTQYIGVILGTIAPLLRCFPPSYWRLHSVKGIINRYGHAFRVEGYWTRKLSYWGRLGVTKFHIRRGDFVITYFRNQILSVCVWLQMTIVVACKMVAFIPNLFMCTTYLFLKRLRVLLSFPSLERSNESMVDAYYGYVLQVEERIDGGINWKQILKSVDLVIEKAQNKQPKYLNKLLEEPTRFEGIQNFYKQHVPPLTSRIYLECWSLSLVTMTIIATSLPDIPRDEVESLLRSMREGLSYVFLVEERLNATNDYPRIQKVAEQLWLEFEYYHKWLGNTLKYLAPPDLVMNATRQILERFKYTSEHILTKSVLSELVLEDEEDIYTNTFSRRYCANSMYQTTQAILLSNQDNIDELSQERLFDQLSSLMADIFAACLNNLPRVIVSKCHTNMTQERKANVHAAARILGETTPIINKLQLLHIPRFINPDDSAFLGKWREYYEHESVP